VIARLITADLAGLRRSFVPWLATLLVVGGSIVARVLAWVTNAIGRTELGAIPFVPPDMGWSDVAVPLALLAYLIVTSYVFGRDFEDGTIDLILTAPVRRASVVVARTIVIAIVVLVLSLAGWGADVAMRALLATSPLNPGSAAPAAAALGSAIAAIATLPLVAWAAIRFRGVLPALGLGIAIQITALALGGLTLVQSLPWLLPSEVASGGNASWLSVGLSALLFTGGLAASVRALRSADLYD
jgi:ABC-type transport system involved in multi-copper enzyme maturation permease subunit